jgi:tetratricopeptide (TPR) repeat protein
MNRILQAVVPLAFVSLLVFWLPTQAAVGQAPSPDIAAEPEKSPEELDAISAFKNRDFDKAFKRLKEACKKNPDLPPPCLIMASWFAQNKLAQPMWSYLERQVSEDPTDPEAYLSMGGIALNEHRITMASLLFEKADALLPKVKSAKRLEAMRPQVLQGLAAVCQAREQWEPALKYLDDMVKLKPDNIQFLQQLAQCQLRMAKEQDAIATLKRICKLDPNALPPETAIFLFYAQTEKLEGTPNTKAWLEKTLAAAQNNHKDIASRFLAARYYYEQCKFEEADKIVSEALKLDGKSLDANVLSGMIAMCQKKYEKAEAAFQAAYLRNPNNFLASNYLALALIEQGNIDKDDIKKQRALSYAEANVRACKEQAPEVYSQALSTLGWVLYRENRLSDAENALKEAVSGKPSSPETRYYLAVVMYHNNPIENGKTAMQLLREVLKYTGPFPQREDAKKLLQEIENSDARH